MVENSAWTDESSKVFVANAAAAISKPLVDMSLDEVKSVTTVNYDGVIFCAKSAGTIFKKQGFGNLIITSSISAHIVSLFRSSVRRWSSRSPE